MVVLLTQLKDDALLAAVGYPITKQPAKGEEKRGIYLGDPRGRLKIPRQLRQAGGYIWVTNPGEGVYLASPTRRRSTVMTPRALP